jgi:hypothetical protein
VAQELAAELDEELFREARAGYEEFGDTPEPDWDDFEGLHFVEPLSQELADDTADELAEGLIVQVELPSSGMPVQVELPSSGMPRRVD